MFRHIPMKCHSSIHQRHLFKKQQHIVQQSTVAVTRTAETSTNVEKIVRPKRIDRSPTDLLYTLSQTIGRDSTGQHYKFHDDPFLIPMRYSAKEIYALAQESGKRTAQWIRDKHGELFNSDEAAPKIEAFMPKAVYTEHSDVTLDQLKETIDAFNATDAELIYKLLIAKNIEIPIEVQQSLLELVSFYNHQNPLPFDLFEERAAVANSGRKTAKGSHTEFTIQWKENCFANILFGKMEPKTPAAYNTMIRAMYKYGAYDKAFELFEEAKQMQIPIDLATYNSYLRHLSHSGPIQTIELRWETVKTTLKELNDLGIKPNVHTLNAILVTIRAAGNYSMMPAFASAAIAEFQQRLHIEPSLETYWHILCTYYNQFDKSEANSQVLDDILIRLERQPDIVGQSVNDLQFFANAMSICRYRLRNGTKQARRLDALVTHGENIKFLGTAHMEQTYYRDLLMVILNNEPLDTFFETYDQLVPVIYSLEPSMVAAIISILDSIGEIKYIPKLWADIVAAGISRRTQDSVLKIISDYQPMKEDEPMAAANLNEQFADMAWYLYQSVIEEELRNARNLLHAEQLSQTMTVLLRANRFESAKLIVERALNQKKGNIVGCLTATAIEQFIDGCIASREPRIAIKLIGYSIEMGVGNSMKCARKLFQSLTLSPPEIKQITDLVGSSILTN